MKRTLISLLCVLSLFGVSAQQVLNEDVTEAQSPVNIGLDEVNNVFTPPAYENNLKSGQPNTCDIVVTYINFPEEAREAMEYAVSVWEKCISSSVQINMVAKWEELSKSELAHGKPSLFYRNFKGVPLTNVFYPVALVEKLAGKEYNNSDEADITCSFNKSISWYFGTDGKTPGTKYDFVTAVLHEIGHGLGISGFFTTENGIGKFNNSSNSPSVYDYYVFNQNNQRIADQTIFPTPSAELTKQLTSSSLVFNLSSVENENSEVSIYAPSSWENGLSIYHLEKSAFSTSAANELMSAHAFKGEAIHNPGAETLNILSALGWGVNSVIIDDESAKSALNPNKEINAVEDLNIYPNPFSGSLTFDCENVNIESSVDIVITDLMGSTVYRETKYDVKYNPRVKIDVSDIKPGIYLASLTDSNLKTISTKRIIKN